MYQDLGERMKKWFLGLALLFSVPVIAFDPIEDGFVRGSKALRQNDLKQAAEIWFPIAERGHAGSQIYLVYVLTHDLSLIKTNPKIRAFLKRIAEHNESEQILLWKVYQEEHELEKANYWLKKSGKTEAEAEQIFQQDKTRSKSMLDDFLGLHLDK